MRRPVIVSLVLAALAFVGFDAGHADAQALGVRGGLSLATFGGDDSGDFDTRAAIAVGGTVTIPVSPTLGIQLGLGYAQKGGSATEDGVDLTLALDYVEVPALLRFDIPTAGTISPRFYLGPTLSFEAGCSIDAEAEGISVSFDCDESFGDLDIDVETRSYDFGAMAGAGLSFGTAGPLGITLDVFYNLGLSSIDDSDPPGDVKNRAWSLLAGIELPLGG